MQTIQQNHTDISIAAQNPLKDMRHLDECPMGCGGDQGDLIIRRIEGIPAGAVRTNVSQLAQGSTQGSRHTVLQSENVIVYRPSNFGEIVRSGATNRMARAQGYVIEAKGRFTIEHPEHADHSYPEGIYTCDFQVDGKTWKQVQD